MISDAIGAVLISSCFSRVARGSAQSQYLSGARDYPYNQHQSLLSFDNAVLHFDDEFSILQ